MFKRKNYKPDKPKEWSNSEVDTTIRLIGGLFIFLVMAVLMLVGDIWFGKKFITPELGHTLFATVGMWVAYQAGKKSEQNGNGYPPQSPPQPQQKQGRLR